MNAKNNMFVLWMLVGVLLLAACAPAATEAPEPAEPEETEVVAEETEVAPTEAPRDGTICNLDPPAEEVTINFFGWTYPVSDAFADEFAKCGDVENIEVNVQMLGNAEVKDAVNLALAGGAESPYAIIQMANPTLVSYASQGFMLPLNDLIDKYRDEYNLDDISQVAWDGATFEGNIYGVPSVGNTKHLAYRTDLFEKYGLDVPTTWDEVIAACAVLADEESIDIPFTLNLHAGWAWELQFRNSARIFGMPAYVNDDNTPAFNGPEGVAGAELIKEVADACMGEEGLTYSIDDSEVGMETGGLAFVHIWASRGAPMHDPEKSDFVDQIAFAPAVSNEAGGMLTGGAWNDFYGIPATSTVDPELAFLVIMESLDAESQAIAAEYGIITRLSVTQLVPNGDAAATSLANGTGAYSKNPANALAISALGSWLPFIGTGEMTPQEALDAAAEEYIAEATAQGFLE